VRPVNLIPPEDRRGERAPMRTGSLAYVVVAVLAVALVAVTLTVVTNNQVSDRKAEKASLEEDLAQAEAEAARLRSFAEFASLEQAREQTVSTLAQSRFDWERVLRELAIVIPPDVWLTNLSASVSPGASSGSSSSTSSTSTSAVGTESITGPSLQIQGCADGHEAVATFIAALHDVDGVTRVTVLSSDRPDAGTSGASTETSETGGSEGCSARGFLSEFQVVAAFDAVQLESAPGTSTPAPTPTTPASETTSAPTSTTTDASQTTASTADQGQVADAEQQLQQQKDSAAEKSDEGRKAVNTFVPGTGSAP
jgi:Tfp pilus assembly protein PilN